MNFPTANIANSTWDLNILVMFFCLLHHYYQEAKLIKKLTIEFIMPMAKVASTSSNSRPSSALLNRFEIVALGTVP